MVDRKTNKRYASGDYGRTYRRYPTTKLVSNNLPSTPKSSFLFTNKHCILVMVSFILKSGELEISSINIDIRVGIQICIYEGEKFGTDTFRRESSLKQRQHSLITESANIMTRWCAQEQTTAMARSYSSIGVRNRFRYRLPHRTSLGLTLIRLTVKQFKHTISFEQKII